MGRAGLVLLFMVAGVAQAAPVQSHTIVPRGAFASAFFDDSPDTNDPEGCFLTNLDLDVSTTRTPARRPEERQATVEGTVQVNQLVVAVQDSDEASLGFLHVNTPENAP